MDPYLEGSHWQSFHGSLAHEIARQLSSKLPDRYAAWPDKYLVLSESDGVTIARSDTRPDVSIVAEPTAVYQTTRKQSALNRPLRLTTLVPSETPCYWVKIFRDDQELVTSIEVLSPANKNGEGRVEYIKRRNRVLKSGASLVEVDLIRAGDRPPIAEPLPAFPYFVFVCRARKCPSIDVWPIGIDEELPVVPIPLAPGDPDVELVLQEPLSIVYREFRYGKHIKYSIPPPPPRLSAKERGYVVALLKEKGYKPTW
jgi:hypothetical protein